MKTKIKFAISILLMSVVTSVMAAGTDSADFMKEYKASFDCRKAGNYAEQTVCSSHHLGQLDGLLNATYKSRLSPQFGSSQNLIKKQQRAWMQQRNACKSVKCIEQAYANRIRELCAIDTVVSGVYPKGDCDQFVEEMDLR